MENTGEIQETVLREPFVIDVPRRRMAERFEFMPALYEEVERYFKKKRGGEQATRHYE